MATVKELRITAKAAGITGYSRMLKADLEAAIAQATAPKPKRNPPVIDLAATPTYIPTPKPVRRRGRPAPKRDYSYRGRPTSAAERRAQVVAQRGF